MKQYFLLSFFILFLAWNSLAQNCTINAGAPSAVCLGEPIGLDGSVGGNVNASSLQWSLISQPEGANAVITNTKSLLTSVTNASVVGVYTFRLSAVCGDAVPAQNDVTITVNPVPAVPVITGTANFPCYNGGPINLTGTAPGPGETVLWSVVGPGSGTFGSLTSNTTTFTPIFPTEECGTSSSVTIRYRLISNGCESSVTRVYTFVRNYGLWATANPTQVCGTATVLKGSCTGTGTALWSQISGPNTAAIVSNTSRTTTAGGLVQGSYVFRYTVTGGCSPGFVDVNVNVAGSSAVTQAIAGPDQHYCETPDIVSLTGNKPAVGETGTWSQLSGATATVISNPANFNTTAGGLTDNGSPYTFLYTISNGVCFTVDSVGIYKLPELSLTGSDIDLCGSTLTTSNIMTSSSFGYHQLDTVRVNITMLSGPPGIPSQPVVRKAVEPGSATPVSQSSADINVGQTASWTLSGDDLYYPISVEPASKRYYLDFPFRINSGTGIFKYRVSVTTQCNTVEKEVTIARGYTGAGVNAGTDIALPCNTTSTQLAGNLLDGRGLWSTVSSPAGATDPINAGNQSLRNPSLGSLIPGTYVFRYTNNTGPSCDVNQFDEIKLVISNTPPPTPVAGSDVTTCAGSFQFSGSAIPADAFAAWTVTSPAASGVTFSNPSVANPVAQNLQPNTTYVFRYTFNNGCGTTFDEISVTTNANAAPPKPSITSNFSNCGTLNRVLPSNVTITVNHPEAAVGTNATWTVVTQPAGIAFTTTPINSTSTSVSLQSVSQSTVFSVIYSLSNTDCPLVQVSDTLTGYIRKSTEPLSSAGPNQQLCSVESYPLTVTMNGSVSTGPMLWSQIYSSNGSLANITSADVSNTTVTIPSDGMYRFKYQVQSPTDAGCQGLLGEDVMQVTASSPGPVALAGSDINFCNSTGVTALNASAVTTGRWEIYQVLNGTAPTIATVTSATSNLTFRGSGSAVLRWSSYGNILECGPSSSDLVTVTYTAPANAGNDLELCQVNSVHLAALSPGSALGTWSQIDGPTASIASVSDPKTLVSGLVNGTYTFRYSVDGAGGCATTDDVSIVISDNSEVSNAGTDYESCSGGNNLVKLNASAPTPGLTGVWSVLSKPAGVPDGNFSDVTNPEAIYDGVTQPGKYVFVWTITDGICQSTDYVEVTAGNDPCSLPVVLINFTLLAEGQSTQLNWATTEETNSDRFEIERSNNAKKWTKIGTVKSNGESRVFQSYSFTDASPLSGANYYRLKMIDRDDTFAYSSIRNATFNNLGEIVRLYPNPASEELHVEIRDWSTIKSVKLLDINGQVVRQVKDETPVDIKSLAPGMYMVQVTGTDGISNSHKVVIAK